MDEFIKYDKTYSDENVLTYINNVFIQILLAISTKEISNIDHFVGDNVYNELKERIEALNQNGYTQKYDELNVFKTTILLKKVNQGYLTLKVELISRALDYVIDANKEIVLGNKLQRVEKKHYLTFQKNINTENETILKKCPTCGAGIDVNANGKCPYCHSIFDMENHGWVLMEWSNEE